MAERRRVQRSRFALSLRLKIILTVGLVAVGVAFYGAWDSYYAHIEPSRGRFLRKHYNRFDEYRQGLGESLTATTAFVALDPALRVGLDRDDVGAVREAVEQTQAQLDEAAQVTVEGIERSADDNAPARAADALHDQLAPDLLLIVDRRGERVAGAELDESEATRSRLLADLRSGITVVGELALLGDRVYQVYGSPVRNARGDVVGAVILGHGIERYMADYQRQSDPNEAKQHRLALIDERGRLLATTFDEEQRESVITGLVQDPKPTEREGGDGEEGEDIPIIALPTPIDLGGETATSLDFWQAPARGYVGNDYGDIGSFYLLRWRDFKEEAFLDRFYDSLWKLIVIAGLAILIGVFLAWGITRRIRRYVAATEDLAQGQGDLTRRIPVDGQDELALLADNLNRVFAYTHDLASNVQSSAFQVGASSAEISAASKQMLDGAQEQARKTESSTAAVTELSASIQQVAENAMEATRVARSSGQAVQSAIERMNEIRVTVEQAASRIHELGESGKRIGNIVEVIRQISDQTTLLALNAAIEAAHAGEQGRGFAVVADEVSGLAKRVGQSARDIEDLIATIKEQTVEAVHAMEAGTHEVEAGTTLVTNTLNDLNALVGVVEDTAKAVQEQAVASDEIARNMDVVQRIAQDVLGASEEAVSQGDHLHRLAHTLEESVKGFRIKAEAKPSPFAAALPPDGSAEE